jgi:hypothetical protein
MALALMWNVCAGLLHPTTTTPPLIMARASGAFPPGRWQVHETNDPLLRKAAPTPLTVLVQSNYFKVNSVIQGNFDLCTTPKENGSAYDVRMSLWGLPFPRRYLLHVLDPNTVMLTRKQYYYKLRHLCQDSGDASV